MHFMEIVAFWNNARQSVENLWRCQTFQY
jgi:hypothetical protein